MHPLDFGGLVVIDIVGELEQQRVVGRTRLVMQFLHHRHRAFMVGDHELKEHPVEIGTLGIGKFSHLFRSGHAGHPVAGMHSCVVRRIRRRLAAIAQPLLHECHLVLLGEGNSSRRVDHLLPVGAIGHEFGHLDGLMMVRNHVLHEPHVRGRIARVCYIGRFFGGEFPRRFARRAGLNDGRLGRGSGRHT